MKIRYTAVCMQFELFIHDIHDKMVGFQYFTPTMTSFDFLPFYNETIQSVVKFSNKHCH
jgi:hypothetical protein